MNFSAFLFGSVKKSLYIAVKLKDMREIKFRGKRVNTNEWTYGFLTSENTINNIEVIQMTIGQYTGFKDRNDVDVYEWDVVMQNGCNKVLIEYGLQEVDYYEIFGFSLYGHPGEKYDGKRLKNESCLIGNIFDGHNYEFE